MAVNRMVVQSPMRQGTTESIAYVLDVSNWGNDPVTPQSKVWQGTTGSWADLTSTIMPAGSSTTSGNYITLPTIKNIQESQAYLVTVTFTLNSGTGNTESAKLEIIGEK
jgi:hypothetical protein